MSRAERDNLYQREAEVEEVKELESFKAAQPETGIKHEEPVERPVITEGYKSEAEKIAVSRPVDMFDRLKEEEASLPELPVTVFDEPEEEQPSTVESKEAAGRFAEETPEEPCEEPEVREEIIFTESPLVVELDSAEGGAASDYIQEEPGISVEEASDENVEEKVQAALADFRQELKQNIQTAIDTGGPGDHMTAALDLPPESIKDFQLLANIGAANAAESMSKILSKRIDLSIPEVNIWPVEKIPEKTGFIDSAYIGVVMPFVGQASGTLLFILDENIGFSLIDMLYGSSTSEARILDEDGESALKEVTNIVGSSVLNVFAEKTGLAIKPEVPLIVHDYMQSILDSVLVKYNMTNDYAIIMDTAFFFEDDRIIGDLMLLPDADSAKEIVQKLRMTHV